MNPSYFKALENLKSPTWIASAHWLARGLLKGEGYRWEKMRRGELNIGIWKKSCRKKDPKSAYPKRFVLVPGFGDTPMSWYGVLALLNPFLKKNFDEIILLDFPGFGGFLSRESAFPSIDLLMEQFNDTLDVLKPHTVLGHSLGGWLTANYATLCGLEKRPLANRLNYSGPQEIVLVNPSGIFLNPEIRQGWENLFRSSIQKGFQVLRPHLFAKEPIWFRFVAPQFEKFSKRDDIVQFINSFREDHLLQTSVQAIRSRVWILWGEKDTLTPSSCAREWVDILSSSAGGVHGILIRGAGHSPQVEKTAITAVILRQALSGHSPHPLGKRWWTSVLNTGIGSIGASKTG